MTRHGQILLQPSDFRAVTDVPMWAHFPRLHLLLGWGPGIWETIGAGLAGLRHVFLPVGDGRQNPPVASVMDWRDNYYQFSHIRDHAPSLSVEGVGRECVRFVFGKDGSVETAPVPCPDRKPHVIAPDGEYRVRHVFEEAGPTFTLERRTRSLKPEYRQKLESLGLSYAPGVGKRDAKPDGQRNAAEQAFVEQVSRMKASFIEKRTKELFKDPAKRPSDFADRRAAHARRRMGEIERRKRDGSGKPKRPYAPEDLDRYTCGEIARIEARDLMFDHGSVAVCALSPAGFRTFE